MATVVDVLPNHLSAQGAFHPYNVSDPTLIFAPGSNFRRLLGHLSELWILADANNGMRHTVACALVGPGVKVTAAVRALPIGATLSVDTINILDGVLGGVGVVPIDLTWSMCGRFSASSGGARCRRRRC